jgi:hypothetical protein
MAATRFYFPVEGSGAPNISPAFNGGWEQTGQATRLKLLNKQQLTALSTIADDGTRTVPITTTQDILCNQFISASIPPQKFDTSVKFSLVIRVVESSIDANVTLAVVVGVVSQDGGTSRGTLFSTFTVDTEFPTTAATRIQAQSAVTAVTTQPGDRLVVEIGAHAAGPASAQTYTMRQGNSAATDFALTTALTTDLNPWCEFSSDLFASPLNNYQFAKSVSTGIMSVTEMIR